MNNIADNTTRANACAEKRETAHTPLPWTFVYDDPSGLAGGYVAGPDGNGVRSLHHRTEEEMVANGLLIVRACNSHDDLLAACEEAACWIAGNGTPEDRGAKCANDAEALTVILAAIAKAKAGASS